MTDEQQPFAPTPTPAESAPTQAAPFWRRTWFIGLVALVVGIGIGAASGGGTDAPEAASPAPTVTATVEGDPLPAETITVDPVPDVQASLDAAAAALDQRSADLDAREAAITGQEAAYEAGTVPGDGTFLVGSDVQPGTYKSGAPSSGNCYWARLNTDDSFDIIDNSNSSGPSVVTIKSTDYAFESSGCSDWHVA